MSIYQPIDEGNDGVFKGDPRLGLRIEIERHVLVSSDVHELLINVEYREQEGLLLEISENSCPIHIFFNVIIIINYRSLLFKYYPLKVHH